MQKSEFPKMRYVGFWLIWSHIDNWDTLIIRIHQQLVHLDNLDTWCPDYQCVLVIKVCELSRCPDY